MSWPELPREHAGGAASSPIALAVRRHVEVSASAVRPVTADEARGRAALRVRALWSRPLLVAATALAVLGILAALSRQLDDREDATVVDTDGRWPLTLDGHRDWLIAVIDGEHEPTDDELGARLDDAFLRAVPPDAFDAATRQIRPLGPWSVMTEVERRSDALALQLQGADDGQQARLSVAIADDGRLAGALVLLAPPCGVELVEAPSAEVAPALQARLDWLLEVASSGREVDDDELAEVIDPAFLRAMPGDEMRTALAEVAQLGPLSLRWFEDRPSATELAARVGIVSGEEARVRLSIEPEPPHRITGASVLTWEPCALDLAGG